MSESGHLPTETEGPLSIGRPRILVASTNGRIGAIVLKKSVTAQ
jgi:hypothetical protein